MIAVGPSLVWRSEFGSARACGADAVMQREDWISEALGLQILKKYLANTRKSELYSHIWKFISKAWAPAPLSDDLR